MAAGSEDCPRDASNIRVAVRCRPFAAREIMEEGGAHEPVLECTATTVRICDGKVYSYDHVAGSAATQQDVFEAVGAQLVEDALSAYNGCVFAYGQTGSGKSYSVIGDVQRDMEKGILPRACNRLFELLSTRGANSAAHFQATVLASYLEIYNEKVYDLLASDRSNAAGGAASGIELQMRYHPQLGSIVVNLTECPMECFDEALELLDFGAKKRVVGATQMNATSSRSHAVFTIQVRTKEACAGGSMESHAKVHFVDLAGSEKQKKTGASGNRLKEGIGINQSLTTLGRVISDLTKPSARSMPAFRDSKLTLLLKDALMGNSRTVLLACISPSKFNLEESISTLDFASRCKLVKTVATKNEQSKVDVIAKLKDEKDTLVAQLEQERANSDALCKRYQADLASAAERERAVEEALAEKRAIEEKLKQIEQLGELHRARGPEQDHMAKENTETTRKRHHSKKSPRDPHIQYPAATREDALPPKGTRVVVELAKQDLCGTIRHAGATSFAEGALVGIELDLEKGKNDGSVQGVRYFTCTPGHGLFLRPEKIKATTTDCRGRYTVTRRTVVSDSRALRGGTQVGELNEGDATIVHEIAHIAEDETIRAYIENPTGWVTLVDMKTGQRCAVPDDDVADGLHGDSAEAVKALRRRLSVIKRQEENHRVTCRKDQELKARLEQERKAQELREQELSSQMEALRSVQESFALDQAQISAMRELQHGQRVAALSKLGMHFMGLDVQDMLCAPKLVNLHPDPALEGCLVYYLPVGETSIGSDSDRCKVTLSGLNVGAEVCVIANMENKDLMLRPLAGGFVRVNGCLISNAGSELSDGDRLAIGRAYIFQVQVPLARSSSNALKFAEGEFERAMEEIAACAEVDPQFENGLQKAMLLVKSDFGEEAANRLLHQAKRGTEACEMANGALEYMPKGYSSDVTRFELSIMFDTHGLPEVCVVARRAASAEGCGAGELRSVGPSAGIWEVEHFWRDRLPPMYEALSVCGLEGSQLASVEEPAPLCFESHVWSEVSLEDYRRLLDELSDVKRHLSSITAGAPSARPESRGTFSRFISSNAVSSLLRPRAKSSDTRWLFKRT